MAFDDLLGPRKEVLDTPVERVNEKNAMPSNPCGELDLKDLLGDEEADDSNGNTLGDPWGNVPTSNSKPNPDPDDGPIDPDNGQCEGDCDSGACGC